MADRGARFFIAALALGLAVESESGAARAAARNATPRATGGRAAAAPAGSRGAGRAKPGAEAKGAAPPSAPQPAAPPGPTPSTTEVRGAPKGAVRAESTADVVSSEENKEGVKTYQFGAVEVEGRLRSPQLIYFLRRVRAEFVAGELGHRSFLPELSDTGRRATFR